jgi:mRNA interferase MazF
MNYKRGQIVRVNLEPTQGGEQQGMARPCVIFSITPLNAKLRQVGVVPLSTSAKVLPPIVVSVPSAGAGSVALCHQLRTINKARIGQYMGGYVPCGYDRYRRRCSTGLRPVTTRPMASSTTPGLHPDVAGLLGFIKLA